MRNPLLSFLVFIYFIPSAFSQCPPNAYAFVSAYPQCSQGCGVLLKDWPEGVVVNVYGGSPIQIITSAVIPGTFGGPGVDGAFVCVPCNIPLLFASAIPGATYGCVVYSLGTVPVKLTNFSLNSTGTHSSLLKWTSSNEQGIIKYTVQRSKDSRNFSDITTLVGNGSNSNSYSYTDRSFQEGIVYYRIKITEITGSVSFSETALVKNQNNLAVSLYPNPADNAFKVTIPGQFLPAKVIVYNAIGKVVYSTNAAQSTLSINEHFAKGIYAVKVTGNNNAVVTQTLMIK
jgi:Secretion system C-terminal sorting domain